MSEEPLSYYQRNKEKCKKQAKAYQQKHREEYRDYHRHYYLMNRDELLRKNKAAKQKRRRPRTCVKPKKEQPVQEPVVLTPLVEMDSWTLVIDKKEVTVTFE